MEKKRYVWHLVLIIFLIGLLPARTGRALPSAAIVIHTPGFESTVISPILINATLIPGANDLIRITLIDERRSLLARKLIRLDSQQKLTSLFSTQLAFEIPSESTLAVLTLETQDEYSRPISLRAIPLTLCAGNEVALETQPLEEPWLILTEPVSLNSYYGNTLSISGIVTPISTLPIIFELITDTGGLIGSKQLAVNTVGEELSFDFTMAYSFINSTRDVRLIVRQAMDPFGVNVALDSVPIFLSP